MQNQTQTPIRCTACGQPFNANIRTVIDVSKDPQAKALLLNGSLNQVQCPHCGTENVVAAPLLYHDPTKELLIALVPMELDMSKEQQEKVIGDLMNQMPKDDFKAYMFNPRRALTMQGLIEQVLEAEGVTPEMMQEQRARVQLAQQMVETSSEEQLAAMVREHDDEIDAQFFQTLGVMAQRMLESGQQQLAQHILTIQQYIAEISSYGQELIRQQDEQQQIIAEVANEIQQLGANATRDDFYDLAVRYASDNERLQALVALVRPAFDYQFFQEMNTHIGQAPSAERNQLNDLRERLLELTNMVDQQAQMAVQNAAGFLQTLLNHENPAELVRANLTMIDDTFMAVLSANIQEAERNQDIEAAARLKEIYQLIVDTLQENMQPELRFVNELLSASTDEEAAAMINERAQEFGETLLEVMDAVEEVVTAQGDEPLVQRLKSLRTETQQILST